MAEYIEAVRAAYGYSKKQAKSFVRRAQRNGYTGILKAMVAIYGPDRRCA